MKSEVQSKSQPPRTRRWLVGALALAVIGGLALVGFLVFGQQSATAEPTIPSGAHLSSWFDNGQGGRRVLQLAKGEAPPIGVRVSGIVATDTNCDPDALGLSHCHNIIELTNGRRIEIINTHLMSVHPCLQPGERVSITRLNAHWVVASENSLRLDNSAAVRSLLSNER